MSEPGSPSDPSAQPYGAAQPYPPVAPVGQPYPQQQPYGAQQPYAGQPYPGQPYQGYPSQQYAPVTPTNTMAMLSMIAGIAGLTLLPVIGSIAAVIMGPMARKEMARTGEQGQGMATAGVITGWIGIGLAVLGILAFLLFWGVFAASFSTIDYN